MPATVSLYDHTAQRFASGANSSADTYAVRLYSTATFNGADTTLAGITGTEFSTANGYTAGGAVLSGVSVSTVTTNDATFDANDVQWTASGGSITASYAVLYNDTDSGDPPVLFIDFDGAQTATDGSVFKIVWDAAGIVTFTVT